MKAQVLNTTYSYLDASNRVNTDRYATRRFALMGDAAYGNAWGGFGTGLSIVSNYVLGAPAPLGR